MSKSEKAIVRAAMRMYRDMPFSVRYFEMKLVKGVFKPNGKVWYQESYANALMQACARHAKSVREKGKKV